LVVDVRGPNAFGKGHVKGAIDIPHREMTATRMAEYPKDKVFVVYWAGPHCNGANKAALRLARLGLPVKTMIGGVTGWIDEGFTLTPSQLSLWPPESTTSQPSTAASKLQEVELGA
jgi:rhodanese-related sulfurtransferase